MGLAIALGTCLACAWAADRRRPIQIKPARLRRWLARTGWIPHAPPAPTRPRVSPRPDGPKDQDVLPPPEGMSDTLVAVPLPDLSTLGEAVQQQLRDAQASLAEACRQPNVSSAQTRYRLRRNGQALSRLRSARRGRGLLPQLRGHWMPTSSVGATTWPMSIDGRETQRTRSLLSRRR